MGYTVFECQHCGLLVAKARCPVCKKEIEHYNSFTVEVHHYLDEE